ncbi:MAG: hypothetical protein R3313_03290 [Candidatus Saccharimonadales bacterium]|nr:hypothetical protein [Candidatus Saccharimonadales bacterium]
MTDRGSSEHLVPDEVWQVEGDGSLRHPLPRVERDELIEFDGSLVDDATADDPDLDTRIAEVQSRYDRGLTGSGFGFTREQVIEDMKARADKGDN